MRSAIAIAQSALKTDDVPVGALIVLVGIAIVQELIKPKVKKFR